MDELKLVIAQAFKARAKAKLTRAELAFALSLDLRWFSPDESKSVIDAGLKTGLLTEEDGRITPAFDYKAIDVPPGFRPGKDLFRKPLLERIEILLVNSGIEAASVRGLIEKKEAELCHLVTPEVAGLVIARERGLDITDLIDEVLGQLKRG
ncbi:DUF2240 family protein [Methanocella arvoryzae]|uniref:DUF2240 family protein n=1 Tax=Methanocella arvoryzae (strain DSM 22066 / NBRC 105507 / MRE50) TaxID=351160 RepID=Q0W039_METAR|nr:DUF2240 family protein [Methanocella arvoryzae]CAJ38254.1 conserved hypothetical protein [Methanocella arvoryzae MRE50]